MRLTHLRATNFKTLVDFDIPLRPGVTVFTGDIGTGKSNAALALQVGLIGAERSEVRDILRWGATEGSVAVSFQGKHLNTLTRQFIRRGDQVRQGEVRLSSEGKDATVWTTTEAHTALFRRLMGFYVPLPLAHSVFRTVLAVPQEAMRSVLDISAAQRLGVARQVLGLDKFTLAAMNGQLLAGALHSRVRELALIDEQMEELTKRRDALAERQGSLEKQQKKLHADLAVASKIVERTAAAEREVGTLTQEVARTKERIKMLGAMADQRPHLKGLLVDIDKQLDTAKAALVRAEEAERVRGRVAKAEAVMEKARLRLEHAKQLEARCGWCRQVVDKRYRQREIERASVKLDVAIGRTTKWRKRVITGEEPTEVQSRLTKLTIRRSSCVQDLERARQHSKERKHLREELKALERAYTKKAAKLVGAAQAKELKASTQGQLSRIDIELGQVVEDKQTVLKQLGELRGTLAKRKTWQVRKDWLLQRFVPQMAELEKQAAARIQSVMEASFREWAEKLALSNYLSVSIGEDFSPVVETHGHQVSLTNALSGGQRSVTALAWHLALRVAFQEVVGAAGLPLLCLDEPSDGMSGVQLDALREVFQTLGQSLQVILVTHEEALTAAADQVLEFRLDSKGRTHVTESR
jgi:DNA repair exonuclease SbcCD ATPase subunit